MLGGLQLQLQNSKRLRSDQRETLRFEINGEDWIEINVGWRYSWLETEEQRYLHSWLSDSLDDLEFSWGVSFAYFKACFVVLYLG